MGICDSPNNQNTSTTNTGSINPVTTSQTPGTASKVVEESVTNANATATATAEATKTNTQSTGFLGNLLGNNNSTQNQTNNQSSGILGNILGSNNTTQNKDSSGGVLGNILGTNSNTAATNTNTDTIAAVGKFVAENKKTIIDLTKKIAT